MTSSGTRAGIELVKRLVADRVKRGGFDKLFLEKVRITSTDIGRVTAEMTVEKEHTNIADTLPGGMSSYLVDCLSSLALSTCPQVKNVGISLNLHIAFLKPAALGQDIEIISKVDKAGGRMAFLSVDILNKATGELVAKGYHTKIIAINSPKTEIPR